jgi:two-component system chemotaxis response regulator CheY
MRTILRRILADIGFAEVDEAEHGAAALEALALAEDAPDLALIDWNMPVMGGLELIEALRAVRRYDRTRLLMVTSETNPRHVFDALKAGVDEYAMKPITREVIEDKLGVMGLAVSAPW